MKTKAKAKKRTRTHIHKVVRSKFGARGEYILAVGLSGWYASPSKLIVNVVCDLCNEAGLIRVDVNDIEWARDTS